MQAVIFDLFETLVTEWGRPKYSLSKMASDLGVDHKIFRRAKDALNLDHFLGKFPNTIQYIEAALKIMNVARDKGQLAEIAQKREECKRKCFDVIEPKILEMLSALKEKGCKLGLISNCSPEEIGGFYNSDIFEFFDAIVMSCDVGLVKPDVKIYQHCLSQLNEDPSTSLFIGDGGSNELAGAKEAGMTPLKAAWFIKHFATLEEMDKTHPILLEPHELLTCF